MLSCSLSDVLMLVVRCSHVLCQMFSCSLSDALMFVVRCPHVRFQMSSFSLLVGDVLMLVIVKTDFGDNLTPLIKTYPELGVLFCTRRVHTVTSSNIDCLLQQASPVLREWLSGTVFNS